MNKRQKTEQPRDDNEVHFFKYLRSLENLVVVVAQILNLTIYNRKWRLLLIFCKMAEMGEIEFLPNIFCPHVSKLTCLCLK